MKNHRQTTLELRYQISRLLKADTVKIEITFIKGSKMLG